ncbi:MAG: helix-turn-helix domain-containing protein [Candidatus Woesearchaeota archaeon]
MECTVHRTSEIISKKWTLLIILAIYKGYHRYSEIRRNISPITPKILSMRLKELEAEEIIRKETQHSNSQRKTFYYLTGSGKDLVSIIRSIKQWGMKWKFDNDECRATQCRSCNKSI